MAALVLVNPVFRVLFDELILDLTNAKNVAVQALSLGLRHVSPDERRGV